MCLFYTLLLPRKVVWQGVPSLRVPSEKEVFFLLGKQEEKNPQKTPGGKKFFSWGICAEQPYWELESGHRDVPHAGPCSTSGDVQMAQQCQG